MSRSRKKAILKDKPKNQKRTSFYWRIVRSAIKNVIRSCKNYEDLEIPDPKTIVNDYDYCDYKIDYEYDRSSGYFWYADKYGLEEHNKWVKKFKRK